MEYYILPEPQPIIIINPAPSNPLPNPPNTPEQTPKTDENPSDSNKPENNKPDDKNQKPNDDKTQKPNDTQPIVILPPTQYFFIPTNWTYLNPYTWCNIL
ncbi:11666_t:CDS:2 [Scutellospora calospora]|uniref:11666_t:CDS:1 n=1 Tax=Scutellospora calospora TaxID=85575 RepID=A0ACA9KL55_9GLOM|nr:11666_t:CDS:2 [Scutellospora calospora]